jgi:hypothetical protein
VGLFTATKGNVFLNTDDGELDWGRNDRKVLIFISMKPGRLSRLPGCNFQTNFCFPIPSTGMDRLSYFPSMKPGFE